MYIPFCNCKESAPCGNIAIYNIKFFATPPARMKKWRRHLGFHRNIYPGERGRLPFHAPRSAGSCLYEAGRSRLEGGWIVTNQNERSERRVGAIHARLRAPRKAERPHKAVGTSACHEFRRLEAHNMYCCPQ